jgi:hypothetical protein
MGLIINIVKLDESLLLKFAITPTFSSISTIKYYTIYKIIDDFVLDSKIGFNSGYDLLATVMRMIDENLRN